MNQRPSEFRINPQHPLAQGLVFAGLGRHPKSNFYHDLSSHKNHGLLTNMTPSEDWVWVPELGRWALDVDGVDDYVEATSTPSLSVAGDSIALSAWVKPTTIDNYDLIIGKEHSSADSPYQLYALFVGILNSAVHITVAITTGGARTLVEYNTGASLEGLWTHLAVVYDGSNIIIYKKGVSVYTTVKTGNINTNTEPVRIGASKVFSNERYKGLIADPLIYNRALSLREIQALADPSNAMLSGLILPPRRKLWAVGSLVGSAVKTKKGLAIASVKTVKGLAVASVKTYKGLA